MVARYSSVVVEAPVQPMSTVRRSSLTCPKLIVDTNLSDGMHPQSSPLLRSLSAHDGQYHSPQTPSQPLMATAAPTRAASSPATRQMSCPEPSATRQRSDFTSSNLVEFNKWTNCVVSYVNDPENFYCQVSGAGNADRLEALMKRIDNYVSCLPPGIGKLRTATLGQPVIAKYSDDSKWYRARVTGTTSYESNFRVVCCVLCFCHGVSDVLHLLVLYHKLLSHFTYILAFITDAMVEHKGLNLDYSDCVFILYLAPDIL